MSKQSEYGNWADDGRWIGESPTKPWYVVEGEKSPKPRSIVVEKDVFDGLVAACKLARDCFNGGISFAALASIKAAIAQAEDAAKGGES